MFLEKDQGFGHQKQWNLSKRESLDQDRLSALARTMVELLMILRELIPHLYSLQPTELQFPPHYA